MDFGMLGPLQVVRGGALVDLGRTQQRRLLARLLVDGGRPVSVDRLVDDLWGADPPPQASASLQALVSRLRRVLEPDRRPRDPAAVLVTRPPGYLLAVDDDHLDAARFSRAAAGGSAALAAGDASAALRLLDAGLGLWRGEVLADLADAAFVAPHSARYEELRAGAREDHAAALLVTGATAAALAELETLNAEQPLREGPLELLVTALHTAGRTADALDRLRRFRAHVADELGLDPGPRLRDLEVSLLRGEPPARSAAATVTRIAAQAPASVVSSGRGDADRIVGRTREAATLESVLEQVRAGTTRWVVLVGEAGIGKTRLAEHATAVATGSGMQVAWGRCHEDSGVPALWPWTQLLRVIDNAADPSVVLGTADDVGDVAALQAGRFARLDRVVTALAQAARRQPLLVVLDDLQWADPESLRLTDHLAVGLRDSQIALVVTLRSGAASDEVERVVADLARRPEGLRLDLTGLDADATRNLASHVCGDDLTAEEAARLHRRTGGNPYFVTEYARLGRAAVVSEEVPDGVRDVLRRRVAPMPVEVRELLTLAAVGGQDIDLDVLAEAAGVDQLTALERLGPALDARILDPLEAPGRYRFAHALVRSALREDVSDLDRRRLHQRFADALAPLATADPARWLPVRAGHLVGAAPLGDATVTVEACIGASQLAERHLAHDDAVAWRTQALRVIEGDGMLARDRSRRLDVLVDLGLAQGDAGDHKGALDTLAAAVDLAADLGDVPTMARAVRAFDRTGGLWYWMPTGTRPVALIERIDRTLAALGGAETPDLVHVLLVRANSEYYGDQAGGQALATRALAIAERLGDPQLVADALVGNLQIGWTPARMHQEAQLAADLLPRARALGSRRHELIALYQLFTTSLTFGDVAAAQRWHRQATELAQDLRLVNAQVQLHWAQAMFALLRGELARAHDAAREAEALHRKTGLYAFIAAMGQTVGMLAWESGSLGELEPRRREQVFRGFRESAVAHAHRQGDATAARSLLSELIAEPQLPTFAWIGIKVLHARLVADLGVVESATALREELTPYRSWFGDIGTVACSGPVLVQVGRLASLLGDHDQAVTDLGEALERADSARLPVWGVRAREALALALRRRGGPDDVARAGDLLAVAQALAERIGIALEPHTADSPLRL